MSFHPFTANSNAHILDQSVSAKISLNTRDTIFRQCGRVKELYHIHWRIFLFFRFSHKIFKKKIPNRKLKHDGQSTIMNNCITAIGWFGQEEVLVSNKFKHWKCDRFIERFVPKWISEWTIFFSFLVLFFFFFGGFVLLPVILVGFASSNAISTRQSFLLWALLIFHLEENVENVCGGWNEVCGGCFHLLLCDGISCVVSTFFFFVFLLFRFEMVEH